MIRSAEVRDKVAIKRLIAQGVEEGSLQPRSGKSIDRHLPTTLVAEEHGKVVGTAGIVVYDRRIGEVRSVYVDPDHRGKGLGRELVQGALEQPFDKVPCATIFAIAKVTNIFQDLGFRATQGNRSILFKNV